MSMSKKINTLSQEDVVITIELDAANESLAFTEVERDIKSKLEGLAFYKKQWTKQNKTKSTSSAHSGNYSHRSSIFIRCKLFLVEGNPIFY